MESGMVEAADVPRFAGLIRQEAESMRGLIDDVLTLSRLDERVDAPAMPVDLAAVTKRVCARLGVAANERSVVIQQESDPQVVIQGDESLAEQMIYNLVSNAIKYNKEGGLVRVSVKRNEEAVVINVDDEGPGIPPDLRERVFERFYRVETSRSRETGGTGLGLAIVKHAALDLGGSVHVEDSDLGGSRFVVTLRSA
jgi:two-component system, OmpR family, phosphate regulon sensor histidine kinase PhoR